MDNLVRIGLRLYQKEPGLFLIVAASGQDSTRFEFCIKRLRLGACFNQFLAY
jgi:hypothetical protein